MIQTDDDGNFPSVSVYQSLRKTGMIKKNADNNQTEIEPIDYFYPLSITSRAAGTMNGLIDGKETYRRLLICKKGKIK